MTFCGQSRLSHVSYPATISSISPINPHTLSWSVHQYCKFVRVALALAASAGILDRSPTSFRLIIQSAQIKVRATNVVIQWWSNLEARWEWYCTDTSAPVPYAHVICVLIKYTNVDIQKSLSNPSQIHSDLPYRLWPLLTERLFESNSHHQLNSFSNIASLEVLYCIPFRLRILQCGHCN